MFKYMKYEIKGSYKFIGGIIALMLIAFTGIHFLINESAQRVAYDGASMLREFTIAISVLVVFGASLTAFIYIIGLFRKELYEERGYLTFTLPLTGNQILGAKLMVAIMWFAVIALTVGTYNVLLANTIHFGNSLLGEIRYMLSSIRAGEVIIPIIFFAIVGITTLITVYFSIALSRVSIKRKKLGGLWFVVFLILNGLTGYIITLSARLVPYGISMKDFSIANQAEVYNSMYNYSMTYTSFSGELIVSDYLNIMAVVTTIVVGILAFMGTSYILEKKIDM